MSHPHALVLEYRIREFWSINLSLVQRILNYSVDGSIETQPARGIFGDVETSDIDTMNVLVEWGSRIVEDYLVKLHYGKTSSIKANFSVLIQYPKNPADKPSGLYCGPMEVIGNDHPDVIKARGLTTDKISSVNTSRRRLFRHPTKEEIEVLLSIDLDVDNIDIS